jgi:hypothetical protein
LRSPFKAAISLAGKPRCCIFVSSALLLVLDHTFGTFGRMIIL